MTNHRIRLPAAVLGLLGCAAATAAPAATPARVATAPATTAAPAPAPAPAPPPVTPPAAPRSHRDLDWTSLRRWVHVDNVLAAKVPLFEGARREWLAALQQGDSLLGDGRPLFWCAPGDSVQTYFTFYPFRAMVELDARGRMRQATDKIVGKEAGDRYDLGDGGLVSPHYSQIWQRSPADDLVWPGTEHLTERTAGAGRLDIHMPDLQRSGDADSLWNEIRAALAAQQYPLACRNYSSLYGIGQSMMLWLAPDAAALRAAPPLETALVQALGEPRARALVAQFERVFPVRESYELARRPDLSNMGR